MKERHTHQPHAYKEHSSRRDGRHRPRAIAITLNQWRQLARDQFAGFLRHEARWAAARILFTVYMGLCLATLGLFGFMTLPVISRLFFNTWRFWRFGHYYPWMLLQGYKVFAMMLRDFRYRFMFSVGLTEQPMKSPDRNITRLAGNWVHEENTCHNCSRCCEKIGCPLLDDRDMCLSYNSFYWRYYLCGRFPTTRQQLDYYNCPKWVMRYKDF